MSLNPQFEASTKSIFQQIAVAKHPLLISHRQPDGDTLGASLAFLDWFRGRDVKAVVFCVDRPSGSSAHLPRVGEITSDQKILNNSETDLLIFLDCADLEVAGLPDKFREMMGRLPSVNIDHHFFNPNFAKDNLVGTGVTSTCEVVYEMFRTNGVTVTRAMATCLLTGIIFDTFNFSNPSTTVRSLEIAAELVLRGAPFQNVTKTLGRSKPLPTLKIWGLALERLRFDPATGVASTAFTLADLEAHHASEDDVGGISNLLNRLLDAPVSLVLRESAGGKVVGSYRATGDTDVAALAKIYGGGGHKKAAGFGIVGRIVESEKGWKVEPDEIKTRTGKDA